MSNYILKNVKTLILGVGNPILSDDGIGIHVARALKKKSLADVDVEELPASGLELLDIVVGYDEVIIIDAIQTKRGRPGEFYELHEKDFKKTVHGASPHGVNIATALALGRKIVPEKMPKKVLLIAVEADDLVNVGETLTPKVDESVPKIVQRIERELKSRKSLQSPRTKKHLKC